MASSSTNAYILLGITIFYAFVFVMMGLIGMGLSTTTQLTNPSTPNVYTGGLSDIGFFFSGIGFSITNLPGWANFMIFMPGGVTILYIILSWLRGSS